MCLQDLLGKCKIWCIKRVSVTSLFHTNLMKSGIAKYLRMSIQAVHHKEPNDAGR